MRYPFPKKDYYMRWWPKGWEPHWRSTTSDINHRNYMTYKLLPQWAQKRAQHKLHKNFVIDMRSAFGVFKTWNPNHPYYFKPSKRDTRYYTEHYPNRILKFTHPTFPYSGYRYIQFRKGHPPKYSQTSMYH